MVPPGPAPVAANNLPPPVPPTVAPAAIIPVSGVATQNTPPKNPAPAPNPTATKPANSAPPLGATTQATGPAIDVKGREPAISANSYDVESRVIAPEDQSFADMSRKIYGSERYSRALAQFNREHPFADDGLKRDPPQLRPGAKVYYTLTDVLEKKYPEAFTTSPSPSSNAAPKVQFGNPTPLTSLPGDTNVAATPPPGTKSAFGPGPGNTYRVRDGGERLFEIARSMLGDGSRWPQIYRLNPDLQPAYPIPAGTVLKLPAAGN
jgi:hypothetical protein